MIARMLIEGMPTYWNCLSSNRVEMAKELKAGYAYLLPTIWIYNSKAAEGSKWECYNSVTDWFGKSEPPKEIELTNMLMGDP